MCQFCLVTLILKCALFGRLLAGISGVRKNPAKFHYLIFYLFIFGDCVAVAKWLANLPWYYLALSTALTDVCRGN